MNKIFIILGIVVVLVFGFAWKMNNDSKARQEALAQQMEQHKQEQAQYEVERQMRLEQEARDKAEKEQARIAYNNEVQLNSEKRNQEQKQAEQEELLKNVKFIEEKARRNLFDPDAAKFRNIKGNCGEINAKNKMGGYIGYKRFIYDSQFDTVSIEDENDGLYNSKLMDILWEKKCP